MTKRKTKTIHAVDLFAGAGGTSTGLVEAVHALGFDVDLLAINHWDVAIATHTENHGAARHLCQAINSLNPHDLIPSRRLHLLVASPECTDYSNAKGGKPRNDQKRADAWLLMRWIEEIYVENLLIENVKEFVNWGPLNAKGLPDKRHRGKYFRQFIEALKINYKVEWQILNTANFGDATTRERFFLIGKRGKNKKIVFPAPTHASRREIEKAKKQPGLFCDKSKLKQWRSAREIIDWDLKGKSILNRKKPLSENTMRRIFAGLFKYSLKPFIVASGGPNGQGNPRGVDEPIPTVTVRGGGSLMQPFLVNLKATDRQMRDIDEPTFTQTTANHQYLVEPFLIQYFGEKKGQNPLITNLAHTGNRNETMCDSLENPLKTICGKEMFGLIEPYLVKSYGGHDACSVDEPLPTICANFEHYAVAEPYLVKFKNHQDGQSIDDPLQTLTTKDCYGLAIPSIGAVLNIRFRMLQPHELAAAMSFPKTYHFVGNRQEKIKQIGNAVPVQTAKALVTAILQDY